MRDLSTQELGFVYGAGASPMPPSKKPKMKHKGGSSSRKYGKGGTGSGTRNRCGKGGSS